MANKVTRKFTNATTGAPITGGVYELRSVTAPGTPAIQMTEIKGKRLPRDLDARQWVALWKAVR